MTSSLRFSTFSLLIAMAIGSFSAEAQILVSRYFEPNRVIPNGGEVSDARTWEQPGTTINNVVVNLIIDPISPNSGFNGDLFATLRLNGNDAYTVLLNRPGKDTPTGRGYNDTSGLDVSFQDGESDIHRYRQTLSGDDTLPLTGPLGETWSPDGRETNPADVLFSDSRTAFLSSFVGKSVEGNWQLSVADVAAGGGTHRLAAWGVDVTMTLAAGQTLILDANDWLEPTAPAQVFSNPIELRDYNVVYSQDQFHLSGQITGPGTLAKFGPGETVLSNSNNDYSGGTDVRAGRLTVQNTSGSATGSGPISVSESGVLGGTGHISGPLFISGGGTISPGASVGTLTVGDTFFKPGGNYHFQINQASGTPGANPGWDHLAIDGNLSIDADSAHTFRIVLESLKLDNTPGLVHDFNPAQNYSWTIAAISGTTFGFDSAAFVVDTSSFANNLGGGTFRITESGNQLNVSFTPVPEPTQWASISALALLGFATLSRFRKR